MTIQVSQAPYVLNRFEAFFIIRTYDPNPCPIGTIHAPDVSGQPRLKLVQGRYSQQTNKLAIFFLHSFYAQFIFHDWNDGM